MVWRDQKLLSAESSWPKFHVCGNRVAWGNEGVKRGAVAVVSDDLLQPRKKHGSHVN